MTLQVGCLTNNPLTFAVRPSGLAGLYAVKLLSLANSTTVSGGSAPGSMPSRPDIEAMNWSNSLVHLFVSWSVSCENT